MSRVDPKKLASGYLLGFLFFALAALLWLRGLGRLVVPALIIALVAYGVYRVVQKVREPLDEQ